MEDDNTEVDVSFETARVALRELNILIKSTEGESPDPLQDDVFRARDELEAVVHDTPRGEFEPGETFATNDGPVQIVRVTDDELIVTDPTIQHPQDVRSGTWGIDRALFVDDLKNGGVERATLNVVTE